MGNGIAQHKHGYSHEKIYLPVSIQCRHIGILPHHFCPECGLIASPPIGDRPRGLKYFDKVLARIFRDHQRDNRLTPFTLPQLRLVDNAVRSLLGDRYGVTPESQEEIFISCIQKYVNIPDNEILARLY